MRFYPSGAPVSSRETARQSLVERPLATMAAGSTRPSQRLYFLKSAASSRQAHPRKQTQSVTGQPSPHSRWSRNARERTRKARWNPAPNGSAAFGKLADFAATLKKGAHVQVEGELRGRECEKDRLKHKVFECRLESILKLDRTERRGADESDWPES